MWMPTNIPKQKIWFLDRYDWPVEKIKGRPITNLIRLLLYTKRITTHWDFHQRAGEILGGPWCSGYDPNHHTVLGDPE